MYTGRLARQAGGPTSWAGRARHRTASPTTGCGSRSSTPSCTTDSCARFSPQITLPRHHHC